MEITVKIEGLKGVEDALSQAGPKLAKAAVRKGLQAGGQVFVDGAKQRAPVLKKPHPHRQPGDLRDAIDMKVSMSPKQESGTVHVGPKYTDKGDQDPGIYGLFDEYGTEHMAAQPFMGPTFDAENPRAQQAFTEVMRAAVEKIDRLKP